MSISIFLIYHASLVQLEEHNTPVCEVVVNLKKNEDCFEAEIE